MNPDAIKDGGAAYPVAMSESTYSNQNGGPFQRGMSVRDHFAGLAMQARTSDYASCQSLARAADAKGISFATEVAVQSYDMADAMIRAREA